MGSEMLSWLRRRRERTKRTDAKADALIRAFGADAYLEARQRERGADSEVAAQEWSYVALAIARKTGKRVGLDTATRMASWFREVASGEKEDGMLIEAISP